MICALSSNSNPLAVRLPARRKLVAGSRGGSSWSVVKATAGGESRENLDHLQRTNNRQKQNTTAQSPRRRPAASAPLGLWDRFPSARTVQQMMDTMERIMEDPFAYSGMSFPSSNVGGVDDDSFGGYRRGRTPWEIKDTDSEYKMRFDMPGMTKNDVKVSVEEKMLVIRAEKQQKKQESSDVNGATTDAEVDGEDWSARSYGRYSSRIALPESVVVEKIKAEVKDGVLYVAIPKVAPSSKVVDIEVQ